MKLNLLLLSACCILASSVLHAQCGAGYTSAQLNWDMLDYYYNSGSNVQPYGYSGGNYISNAMEQTQRFAIGRNMVTIVTSASGMVDGENNSHTGDIANYTGEDAQYTPSSNGQTITLTFRDEVTNLNFALYDVDGSQRIDFSASNAASTAQNINVALQGSTILSVTNNNSTSARIQASSTTLTNSDNRGTAIITVAGPVKTFRLTLTTIGSNAVFWMSDINACVSGSFPIDYQKTGSNQPLQGPAGNQPDYFLVTPDNNSVYMVNPANGDATKVFQDASKTYVNSFGYDPYRRYLYYISENASVNSNNRELKRYDFNTGTITVLVSDITATLGIPTMGSGVESAGAAFYDDALYLGIEGGKYDPSGTSSDRSRETIIWRIDFDASWNPTTAYQVFATEAYQNASNNSLHDFGDFIIKNGVLYDFNTARNSSSYANSKYHHYDMTTGQEQVYNNPGTSIWNGQAGMGWDGTLYYFRNGSGSNGQVGVYNENGTNGSPQSITVIDGTGAWPGGNGDASENFRPQVDFGDAPASYDPNAATPAAHDIIPNLRIGSSSDKEWVFRGQNAFANADNFDDGLAYVPTFSPDYDQYLIEVTVFNNTGGNATLGGWIDYDGNGIFEAHEGRLVTVPSSPTPQQVFIYWPYIPSNLPFGSSTYLRLRITTNTMTTAHANGWFNNGEVEDYRVPVDNFPLYTKLSSFDAYKNGNSVQLNWKTLNEEENTSYELQRSASLAGGWNTVFKTTAVANSVSNDYTYADKQPLYGISYYRLMVRNPSGIINFSDTRKIEYHGNTTVMLAPNPASTRSRLTINADAAASGWIEIVNSQGAVVYKQTMQVLQGENNIELPVDNLPGGQYIVRVVSNTINLSKPLIVKK